MTNADKIAAMIEMFTIEAAAAHGENFRAERMARVSVLNAVAASMTDADHDAQFIHMIRSKHAITGAGALSMSPYDLSDAQIAEGLDAARAKLAAKA